MDTGQSEQGKRVLLFQYGSNMDSKRLNSAKRLDGEAEVFGKAKLEGHELLFDLWSVKNHSAAADIKEETGNHVWGVLYRVPCELVIAEQGRGSKMDCIEGAKSDGTGNYTRVQVKFVKGDGTSEEAYTYVGTKTERGKFPKCSDRKVSGGYLDHILRGAYEHSLPKGYIQEIKNIAEKHIQKVTWT